MTNKPKLFNKRNSEITKNILSLKKRIGVVDLFCGIGGLTHGFVKEGYDVLAGFDIDNTCKYTYEENNNAKFIAKDVSDLTKQELQELYRDKPIKILIGCAPCQPFSKYSNTRKSEDEKWKLLYKFAHVIEELQPDIVSMENVPELFRRKKYPVYDEFVQKLRDNGYEVWADVVNCVEYGMPQNRKRLILLASKFGEIELIKPTHNKDTYVTVGDVLRDLPTLNHGEQDKNDPVHLASKLSEKNYLRVCSTPYGGSWKDWPKELRNECHLKESGKTYSSVYGRMTWENPSPTMTTQCIGLGNGRFGHPEQNRAISLREAAILQTFPRDYKFIKPGEEVIKKHIARQIGNAVPVDLGRVIAKSITQHFSSLNL
ncbi:MAG: DNA cytosine methyltransferase [Arcobacteraceae bacterium]